MDNQSFKKYLEERYYDQINWYDRKSLKNQRAYRTLQFGLIVLSALTPVLILMEKTDLLKGIPWLFWLPASTAAAVAILTSTIKTFRYQENWINYRTTCETLKKEIHLYDSNLGEYSRAADKHALFIERVESLISRENTLWLTAHKLKEESPDISS